MLVDTDALHTALTDLADQGDFAGTVRIDVGPDTAFEGAYGLASYTWGVPARLDTRYDCASTTKLFTAVATLQQVDAGAFDLGTSAIDYLGLTGTSISPAVTVQHLLSHTSGMGDDADEEAGESYEALWRERPQLLGAYHRGLPAELHPQTAQLRPRAGGAVLQCELHPAGPDDREGHRDELPRLRRRPGVHPGSHERCGVLRHGPGGARCGRRGGKDRRRRVAAEHLLLPADRVT